MLLVCLWRDQESWERERMDVENDTMERKGWTGKFVGADVEAKTERDAAKARATQW